jgi:hypothetical protein
MNNTDQTTENSSEYYFPMTPTLSDLYAEAIDENYDYDQTARRLREILGATQAPATPTIAILKVLLQKLVYFNVDSKRIVNGVITLIEESGEEF